MTIGHGPGGWAMAIVVERRPVPGRRSEEPTVIPGYAMGTGVNQ